MGAEAGHVSLLLCADGEVELTTDGVGFLPCYWSAVPGGVAVSTHLATLVSLGASPEPDEQGVVEYLAMHHPLGTRTLLRDAQMLPAGGRLRWAPGAEVSVSAVPLFVPTTESLTDDAVIASFAELWPEVVADAFGGSGETALGLSGGLDSRAIVEAAVQIGIRPSTYTYGTPPTHEPVVAARVAAALDLDHVAIPVTAEAVLAGGAQALHRLDGAHSASEMYELWFVDTLRSLTGTVVNGLAGGPLWGDDKAVGLTDPRAVLDRQWQRYAADARISAGFLGGDLAQRAPELLRDSLADSLGRWDLGARDDMVLYWKIANRQFRWGNMLTNALRRSGIRAEAPFLDSRFLQLAARLSPQQRRNGNLYLRVHRELFPRTARIPRSDDGNAPAALDHVYWSGETSYVNQLVGLSRRHPVSGVRRAARLGGHLARATLRDVAGVDGPAERSERRRSVFPADVWLRTEPRYGQRLCELLMAGGHRLIDEAAVAAQLSAIGSGGPTAPALLLGRVAAAGVWLSDYESRALTRVPAGA
ncbi:asparagine synthase (glutamine-hydrolysing) [Georgenia satyanarayanai]|uniref:asparagine synthase (glutamine-hydrolyzing) n=1 Tax=Georgenia satyanarayanai TaxID=860221 RepID=A0A2Y9BYE9_9MICO|nr:asparagine synthase-related protein [Georgenia satyanarayanai]PYF99667.1 asparagine synthase (glutamine-hydrolysing) [Georgenia satyanarayanai]SSA42512.1 asparagine synthase (glutamine-hydrolysing) [Georgenia satyanarayanai]